MFVCDKDAVYNGSQPGSWYDVTNWCEADDDDVCMEFPPRRLHTEGIPCAYDDVIFPLDSQFVVDIDSGADIRVNTVRVGQQVGLYTMDVGVRKKETGQTPSS